MKTIEWASGLFEGEGSITTTGTRPKLYLSLTDLDVLQEFVSIIGHGSIFKRKLYKPHHKQAYEWQITKRSVVYSVLEAMLPYLGQRRAYKALNCLDELDKI